jgi:hypothetical protein
VHDAVDIEPDDHLIGMPLHRRQDVPGFGHGVGFPHLAGLLGQYEVMRLPAAAKKILVSVLLASSDPCATVREPEELIGIREPDCRDLIDLD